jgi:hypothetical protein
MPDYARQGRLADEYLAEIAARRAQAELARQPESAAYHCTYCRADSELPRCSNCGAPPTAWRFRPPPRSWCRSTQRTLTASERTSPP